MSLKYIFALALVLVVGVVGAQSLAHAQTTGSNSTTNGMIGSNGYTNGTTGTTGSGTNGTTGTNGSGTTGSTGTTGANGSGTGTGGTATPGVPNTGDGGNAASNILLLAGSAMMVAFGALYFVKEARA